MKIDIDYILECLKEEKYQKVINYLDEIKKHDETRLGNQLIRIIATMNRISKYNKYDYPIVKYENSKENSMSRFFEALKFRDYEEANSLVDNCIYYLKGQCRDYEEMQIYKEVLKYANDVQQKTVQRSNNITRMSNLTYEIETYTKNNKKLLFKDIYWLLDNVEEIIDISLNVNRNYSKMQYVLEIIYTILDFSDGVYRDKNYFGNVLENNNNNTIINKFYEHLRNGQYPSAYKLLKKQILHFNGNIDWIYKLYYILLEYLNSLLTAHEHNYIAYNQNLNYNNIYYKMMSNKSVNDVELLANLVLVKSLKNNKKEK